MAGVARRGHRSVATDPPSIYTPYLNPHQRLYMSRRLQQQHQPQPTTTTPMMMDPPYLTPLQRLYMSRRMSQRPRQRHQPQPTTTTTTTTTSTAQEEEEEEFRRVWIGNLQNWMDKVEEEEVRTLWIGDLQHWMDEDYIDSCFANTGEVFTSKVIRNKKTTNTETCYGFILFKSRAIAERILHRFNGTPMPRVALGTINFSLDWAAKVVVTDGTTTTPCNETPTTTTTTTGQCGVNCMFCSTTSIPILPSIGPATDENTVGVDEPFSIAEMGDNSSWRHMLKWWSLSQFEGTCTAHTVHATHRVYAIASSLFIPHIPLQVRCPTPIEVERVEGYLDELESHVESINVAKELHSMGALEPLLCNMSCPLAGVGARAAKIVRTMVQKDLMSQQLVMEADGGLHLLDTLFSAVDANTEAYVLSAIYSLSRNNIHGGTAFRQRYCYADLLYQLSTASVNCQRKALNLIYCLVSEHKSDCNIVTGLGYHHFMMELAFSYCALVRVAALRCLLLLTQVEGGGNSDQLVKNNDKLKQVLQELIERISAMAPEDLGAAREEIQLVDSLWNACYNKPSSVCSLLNYEEAPALGPPSVATKSCPFWVQVGVF